MLTKIILGAGVLALTVGAAEAKVYKEWASPNNRTCYKVEYIQATYLVNTRGKLVRPSSKSWEGEIVDGGMIYKVRHPAVYKTTRKLIEEDHYTLTPC